MGGAFFFSSCSSVLGPLGGVHIIFPSPSITGYFLRRSLPTSLEYAFRDLLDCAEVACEFSLPSWTNIFGATCSFVVGVCSDFCAFRDERLSARIYRV